MSRSLTANWVLRGNEVTGPAEVRIDDGLVEAIVDTDAPSADSNDGAPEEPGGTSRGDRSGAPAASPAKNTSDPSDGAPAASPAKNTSDPSDGAPAASPAKNTSDPSDGARPSQVSPISASNLETSAPTAIVPGQVNTHSHAFQRLLRGRTEYLDAERPEDDFWSWRELMYRAALRLDPDAFEEVARFTCLEMARAGFTTLGEFHYVHHDPDGEAYANPNELAERLVRAARDVGLRVVLLRAAYHRAGYDRDPNPRQRRFVEPDVDTYLRRVDQLRDFAADRPQVSVGLAPHSIRAVPGPWLETIAEYARTHQLPLHIHASEQRAELEQSRAEYDTTPIAALGDLGVLDASTTIVHATHATESELDLLASEDCSVCACPTTERNLGDGFLPLTDLLAREVPICIGTDSHADIDPWEEMRLVEYHERLRRERRNVAAQARVADGGIADPLPTARPLWAMGTRHGADALGLDAGRLAPGAPADLVRLELDHPALAGLRGPDLQSHLVFATPPTAVRDVYVAGEPIVEEGHHPDGPAIARDFEAVVSDLYDG